PVSSRRWGAHGATQRLSQATHRVWRPQGRWNEERRAERSRLASRLSPPDPRDRRAAARPWCRCRGARALAGGRPTRDPPGGRPDPGRRARPRRRGAPRADRALRRLHRGDADGARNHSGRVRDGGATARARGPRGPGLRGGADRALSCGGGAEVVAPHRRARLRPGPGGPGARPGGDLRARGARGIPVDGVDDRGAGARRRRPRDRARDAGGPRRPRRARDRPRRPPRQRAALPRREVAARALEANGAVIRGASLDDAVELANRLAPEHLELMVSVPAALVPRVRNAGAIFVGGHTPEVVGDYVAGPNHVLPTAGTARFASPLGTEDFVKRSSVIEYSPRGLAAAAPHLRVLTRIEGLAGHGRAAELRLGSDPGRAV